ncbi:MAG: DUF4136 domain-containing protein [Pseudomonadales bacterium]|nr:DUF4136 domain-containing protein [Pseudomonadales bacterium]
MANLAIARSLLFVGFLALLLQGCSRQLVSYDYDPAIDFVAFKSYSWLKREPTTSTDPRVSNDLLRERIIRSIDGALKRKNYVKTGADKADFLIAYQIGIEKRTDVDTVRTGIGFGYRFWDVGFQTDTIVREYNQVSLYIDVVDPQSKQLIWRGIREYRYSSGGTVAERDARIQTLVTEILNGFPPLK